MKRGNRFLLMSLTLVTLLLFAAPLFAQTSVKVTVRVNTSTVADTLSEEHFVQLRGEVNGEEDVMLPDYKTVNWNETCGLVLNNVGGDYWEVVFRMFPGDTLAYKIWTGFSSTTGTSVVWDGWEGDINDPNNVSGNNRIMIAGSADTVVAVQYYNGLQTIQDQYYRPFTVHEDSVAVNFRVNMAGWEKSEEFDPLVDIPVKVYGGSPFDPEDDWTPGFLELTREGTSGRAADFWSGTIYLARTDLVNGMSQSYKFVYAPDGTGEQWEENAANRSFTFTTGMEDTTLHWVYFDNRSPLIGDPITTTVIWSVDPGALQDLGFFDRAIGDKLLISGPKGWTIPDEAIDVVYTPLTQTWIGQESFLKYPGDVLRWKYVVLYDSSRTDTLSENYIPGLPGVELWEEPSSTAGADREYSILNTTSQQVDGDFDYDFQFYASIPPEGVIPGDISVTFNVDMSNAADAEINTTNPLFRPGVDQPYIFFESPLLMLTQGLPAYEHQIDLSDPDGDGIYSAELAMTGPTVYQVGFRVGYTTDTDDVLNGGGVAAGRRYYQFIWPVSHDPAGATVWPSTFEFETVEWTQYDLTSGTPPDFTQLLSVDDRVAGLPPAWSLDQNYPNPFNPTTTLTYRVGNSSRVNVSVYTVLGQKVRTLVDSPHQPGLYRAVWDGLDAAGNRLASGVYFVRLSSPEYMQVRKMTLVR